METWEKWSNNELVADDYELKSLVQDQEGLTLIFLGRKTEVTIVYHEQLLSFRSCDESDRWRTVDNVLADHGKHFFRNWLTYRVCESGYRAGLPMKHSTAHRLMRFFIWHLLLPMTSLMSYL